MGEKDIQVQVRFFGYSAELAGCWEATVKVGEPTIAGVIEALRRIFPKLDSALNNSIRFALGTDYADPEAAVKEGDVVSLIPPVGGG